MLPRDTAVIHVPNSDVTPASLHLQLTSSVQNKLHQISPAYRLVNEFSGLQSGVFPVDCAVYFDSKLVAFVEIDGPHHYTASRGVLRRDDQLKEYLYSKKYPGVTLFRVKNTDILNLGVEKGVEAVAEKLVKLIDSVRLKQM